MVTPARLRAVIAKLRAEYAHKLGELVGIPSVSMEPERHGDVRRCARKALAYLREAGATAELVETRGLPIVLGRLGADAAAPTVTIYNHLDVQPADPADWKTAPFSLRRIGDRYFGRGATDDKGPLLAALFAARLAHAAGLRLRFRFLWECEEEVGSPSFAPALAGLLRRRPPLRTDSIMVSDTIWPSAKRPAIPYGLRGLLAFVIRLRTGAKAVHSGTTGGAARNPVAELAALVAECHDARSGRVKIPGFYDQVRRPSLAERRELAAGASPVAAFRRAHGLGSLRVAGRQRLAEAVMAEPTFEVHGIVGGYAGPGVKTIVPHEAEAKLSCRLVPAQRPQQVFETIRRFVRDRCPEATVEPEGVLEPYLADRGGPILRAAARATREAFGVTPAMTREGGSIGAVVTMARLLRREVVLLGLSLPEDGYHAVDESFAWSQAARGIELFYRYFAQLAAQGHRPRGR